MKSRQEFKFLKQLAICVFQKQLEMNHVKRKAYLFPQWAAESLQVVFKGAIQRMQPLAGCFQKHHKERRNEWVGRTRNRKEKTICIKHL
jgi:hypothetical protein